MTKETVTLSHASDYDGKLTIGSKVYDVKGGVVQVDADHAEAAMQGGFSGDPNHPFIRGAGPNEDNINRPVTGPPRFDEFGALIPGSGDIAEGTLQTTEGRTVRPIEIATAAAPGFVLPGTIVTPGNATPGPVLPGRAGLVTVAHAELPPEEVKGPDGMVVGAVPPPTAETLTVKADDPLLDEQGKEIPQDKPSKGK